MPVILTLGEEQPWMDPGADIGNLSEQYSVPFPAKKMTIDYADDKPQRQSELF
jgi:hypothetical protein